ncbi:MAG: hypothetical protein K0S65_3123, partial [Labilithrix sp.]|nr:hypothetical protein [Labilithrix sp.]
MSCVPGFFFAAGGATDAAALSFALSSACWKAPRCESALLTASGETCEPSPGGRDGVRGRATLFSSTPAATAIPEDDGAFGTAG